MNRGRSRTAALMALATLVGCGTLHSGLSREGVASARGGCQAVTGTIASIERATERMAQPLYLGTDAHVVTDLGVEIKAPELALNTETGAFVLNSMHGCIDGSRVHIELPQGTSLNIESKGPARGDQHGYLMTGGASITQDGATVSAPTIELRFF